MKYLVFLTVASALCALASIPAPASAGCPHYVQAFHHRPVVHRRAVVHHAPVVHHAHHDNYAHHDEVVIVKKVVLQHVSPDYYWSVRDFHRDAIQLEYLKIQREILQGAAQLQAARAGGFQEGGQAANLTAPPASAARPPSGPTGKIDPRLAQVNQDACVRCHGGDGAPKGGLDLRDLARLTKAQAAECAKQVRKGLMPKAANPLSNEESDLWFDFALSK